MLLKLGRWALGSIGALYLLVTLTPIDRWWTNLLTGPTYDPKGDILIVLSGDSFGDVMGRETYLRTLYAVRYWRAGGYKQIFVSGGASAPGNVPIATLMREFLIGEGVPADAILSDTTSISTHENALHVFEALRNTPGRKVLLTSDYHTFRAWRAFRKAGLDVIPSSAPDIYKRVGFLRERWSAFIDLCVETGKVVYYKIRGWT